MQCVAVYYTTDLPVLITRNAVQSTSKYISVILFRARPDLTVEEDHL